MDGNRAARRVFGLLEPFRRLVSGLAFPPYIELWPTGLIAG